MATSALAQHAGSLKFRAARRALDFVEPGMIVGLGSGSTASIWIQLLGERVRDAGLDIRAVATSQKSEDLARSYGIPIVSLEQCGQVDLTVDGADEIAPHLMLLKGGGGKLLHEKIVAAASKRFIVVADSSKVVDELGKFPLPVEVVPMASSLVHCALAALGFLSTIRENADGSTFFTDENNVILDCRGVPLKDPYRIAANIDAIVGVVEHGIFLDMADIALIATEDGVIERRT